MVDGSMVTEKDEDIPIDCDIVSVGVYGRGRLECDIDTFGVTADLDFVIVDSQPLVGDILDMVLSHHPRHVNNLLLNGSVDGLNVIDGPGSVNGTGQLNSQFK